jgi:release factor glutamine methyltransferase
LLLGDADTPIPKRLRGRFDLVVSNPPYIPDADMPGLQPEVRREPRLALVGGPDGLDGLRRMIAAAVRLLRTDGFFVCELGIGQARQAEIIFKQHGFSEIRVREDWQKIPRVISGRKIP